MKKSALCKLSIACAVLCGISCGVAIAPLFVIIAFLIVSVVCLAVSLLVYFFGFFAWLFSNGENNVFGMANGLAGFGGHLFTLIPPITQFSFSYLTPYAGGAALVVGILGIIISSVALSKEKAKKETGDDGLNAPAEVAEVPAAGKGKKRAKKKRTSRGSCIASLTVCIVFTVIALIAVGVSAFFILSM